MVDFSNQKLMRQQLVSSDEIVDFMLVLNGFGAHLESLVFDHFGCENDIVVLLVKTPLVKFLLTLVLEFVLCIVF